MTEITTVEAPEKAMEPSQAVAHAPVAPMPPGLALIHRALDENVPPETMKEFFTMAREMEDREREKQYAGALNQVQAEVKPVFKAGRNTEKKTTHATLEGVHRELQPIYTRHGFSLSFTEADCPIEGYKRIQCHVMHAGGHKEVRWFDVPLDNKGPAGKPNKTEMQGWVSSFSYARRVLESQIFAVVTTDMQDRDGEPEATPITEEQAADLEALCSEVGADRARFLGWLGVESFEALPAGRRAQAVKGLEAKRRQS